MMFLEKKERKKGKSHEPIDTSAVFACNGRKNELQIRVVNAKVI